LTGGARWGLDGAEAILTGLRPGLPAGAAAALPGRAGRLGYRPLLAVPDIPALVVAGTAGPWPGAGVTAEIVSSLKRPEQVIISGAGHLPDLEAEDEFSNALTAFLRARAKAQGHGSPGGENG
jgi:pimeloyl-ACP methyl ester carboxylesterase